MARAVVRAGVPSRYGNNTNTNNETQTFVPGPAIGGVLPAATASATAINPANSTGLLQQNVNTPNGVITVNYSNQNGKYIPIGIAKNITFSTKISQSSNNTNFNGVQNYTYAIKNNSLIQVPTSNNINVSYNANPQLLATANAKLQASTSMLNSIQQTLKSYQNALAVQGQAPAYYNYYSNAISNLLFPTTGPAKNYNSIDYYQNQIQEAQQTINANSPVNIGTINNGVFNSSNNVVKQNVYGTVANKNTFLGSVLYKPSVVDNTITLQQTGFISANVPVSGNGYYGNIATAYSNGNIIISPKNFTSLTSNTQTFKNGQEVLSYNTFPTGFGLSNFQGLTNGLVGGKNIPVTTTDGTVLENFSLGAGFTLGSGLSQITTSGITTQGKYSLTQKVLVNSQTGEVTLSEPSGSAGQISLGKLNVNIAVNNGAYSFSSGLFNLGQSITSVQGNKEYLLSLNNGNISENIMTTTKTLEMNGNFADLGPPQKTSTYGVASANNVQIEPINFGTADNVNSNSIGSLNNPNNKSQSEYLLGINTKPTVSVVLKQTPNAESEYISLASKNNPVLSIGGSLLNLFNPETTIATITSTSNTGTSTTTQNLGKLSESQIPFQTFFIQNQVASQSNNSLSQQVKSTSINFLTSFGQIGYNFVYGNTQQKLLSVGEVAAIGTIAVAGPAIAGAFGINSAFGLGAASGALSVPIGEMQSFSTTGRPETAKQIAENAVLSAATGVALGAAGEVVDSVVTPKITNIDIYSKTFLSENTQSVEVSVDSADQPFAAKIMEGDATAYKTTDIVGGPQSSYTRTLTYQSPIRSFFRLPAITKTDVVSFSSDIYVNNDVASIVSRDESGNTAVGISRSTGKVLVQSPQEFIMKSPDISTSTDLANIDNVPVKPPYQLEENSVTTFKGSQLRLGNKVSISLGNQESNLLTYTSEPVGSLQLNDQVINVQDTVSNVRLTVGKGSAVVNGNEVPVTFKGISGIYSTEQLPNEFTTGATDISSPAAIANTKLALTSIENNAPQLESSSVVSDVPHAFEPTISPSNGGTYIVTSGRSSLVQLTQVAVKPLIISTPAVSTINVISPSQTVSTLIYNNKDPLILTNKNYLATSFAGSSIIGLTQTTNGIQNTNRVALPLISSYTNSTLNRSSTVLGNQSNTITRQNTISSLSSLQNQEQSSAQLTLSRTLTRQQQREVQIQANGESAGQFDVLPNIISPIPTFGIGSRIKNTQRTIRPKKQIKSVNFKYFADFSHSELNIHGKATKIGLSRPIARGRKK